MILTLQAYYIYKFFVYKVFFAVVCLYSLFMYIYIYINFLISNRKCFPFSHWLIPKSCDRPHKIIARTAGYQHLL
jgi:hypothetical protein